MTHENTYRPVSSKSDGKWYVLNDFDECCGGPYDTKAEAEQAFDADERHRKRQS